MKLLGVLCVCFGNACRSPMLEALLRQALSQIGLNDVVVESAGVKDKESTPASDNAKQAMREMGLDLSGHTSRQVRDINLENYDLFYCMEQSQAEILISMGVPSCKIKVVNSDQGGVPNPHPHGMDVYSACATTLARAATLIANEIKENLQK